MFNYSELIFLLFKNYLRFNCFGYSFASITGIMRITKRIYHTNTHDG